MGTLGECGWIRLIESVKLEVCAVSKRIQEERKAVMFIQIKQQQKRQKLSLSGIAPDFYIGLPTPIARMDLSRRGSYV